MKKLDRAIERIRYELAVHPANRTFAAGAHWALEHCEAVRQDKRGAIPVPPARYLIPGSFDLTQRAEPVEPLPALVVTGLTHERYWTARGDLKTVVD